MGMRLFANLRIFLEKPTYFVEQIVRLSSGGYSRMENEGLRQSIPLFQRNYSAPDSVTRKIGLAVNVELVHHFRAMRLGGADADT